MCKFLRETGWTVTRSAGSHGLWDIVAVRDYAVWLIQVKLSRGGKINGYWDDNCAKLAALKVPKSVDKMLFVFFKGDATPEMMPL